MRIEREEEGRRPRRRRGRKRFAALFAGALIYSLLLFAAAVISLDALGPRLRRQSGARTTSQAVAALLRAPANYLRASSQPAPALALNLDVKFKNLHLIHQRRESALAEGVLIPTEKDWIAATASLASQPVEVELRLAGRRREDVAGEKWSFDVRVARRGDVLGMRRFVLRDPELSGLRAAPLYLDHLRREGVLAPRHRFVQLSINGDALGLMWLEEQPSPELLESNQRGGGAIVALDDTPMWQAKLETDRFSPFDNPHLAAVRSAPAGELGPLYQAAGRLLRGFLNGDLEASEAFDVQSVARLLAVSELWAVNGALRWNRLHFLYDAQDARLVPIPAGAPSRLGPVGSRRGPAGAAGSPGSPSVLRTPFAQLWLEDPALQEAYARAIRRISEESATGALRSFLDERQQEILHRVHLEYPMLLPFDLDRIAERALAWQPAGEERPEPVALAAGATLPTPGPMVGARGWEERKGPYVELVNLLPVPVEVVALRHAGVGYVEGASIDGSAIVYPIALPPTEAGARPRPVRVDYALPQGRARGVPLEGRARVVGRRAETPFEVVRKPPPFERNPLPSASLERALARHRFLRWNAPSETLYVLPGTWDVEGWLALPEGLGLSVRAGTTLRFEEGRGLLARGPLRFHGSAEEPIRLEGEPGAEGPWAGVVVLESLKPSRWTHVEVRGAGGVRRNDWVVDAGVLFRRALVELSDVRLAEAGGAAALELRHSTFVLRDLALDGVSGSGLRVLFSEGEVKDAQLVGVGGSGFELHRARLTLERVSLEEVGEAALDARDESQVRAEALSVRGAGFGVIARDGSQIDLLESVVAEVVHLPLLAYRERSEAGPARIEATETRLVGDRVAVAQRGNRVRIDGVEIEALDIDVASLQRDGDAP